MRRMPQHASKAAELGAVSVQIVPVTPENLPQAGYVHALSWQESHRGVCSPAFIAAHTPERQANMLRQAMDSGKQLFLLTDSNPIGIVSVDINLIEHLYVLPERQGQGYGSRLLTFAIERCHGTPTLWVLNSNERARRFYERRGFHPTGVTKPLSDALFEMQMCLSSNA